MARPTALGVDSTNDGVTAEQQQARAAFDDFRGKLSDPRRFGAPQLIWESYDFTALEVFSRPPDTDPTNSRPDLTGHFGHRGRGRTAQVGGHRCLATLKPLHAQATVITLWQRGNASYNVWTRPILPDEAAARAVT
jgi:hypothetical protein